jgi:hypothetical protein
VGAAVLAGIAVLLAGVVALFAGVVALFAGVVVLLAGVAVLLAGVVALFAGAAVTAVEVGLSVRSGSSVELHPAKTIPAKRAAHGSNINFDKKFMNLYPC